MPRYQKPKILLVDTDPTVRKTLHEMGLNIREGTFGQPYKVESSNDFYPVVLDFSLPNASEQELIIIDLATPEIIDHGYDAQSEAEVGLYAKGWGAIDPRPLVAGIMAETFDRILRIGGIFVVFAAAPIQQEVRRGQMNEYRGVELGERVGYKIWHFLSAFRTVTINTDSGEEMLTRGVAPTSVPFHTPDRSQGGTKY
jgi:hypothetical protein